MPFEEAWNGFNKGYVNYCILYFYAVFIIVKWGKVYIPYEF